MSKYLLSTKIVGGALAGTGTVAAGGVCIDQYIKSKSTQNTTSEEGNTDSISEIVVPSVSSDISITPTPAPAKPNTNLEGQDSGTENPGTTQTTQAGNTANDVQTQVTSTPTNGQPGTAPQEGQHTS